MGKPKLSPKVVRGELPDGEVVVSLDGGDRALILNAIGDAVLELCDGSRTIAEIAQFIRETIEVPPGADVTRDIDAMLDELARAGVIEAVA
jgi:coenzyme PQQ synthesis protein D (PqqD)